MTALSLVLNLTGGLCMFLLGMKVMSDGLQKSAGDRLRKTLNFMTGNRFTGVITGLLVTVIIQSSTATTVMVISLVKTGLLSLSQSIGVIFGANIGTTITAWIVSLVGFRVNIDAFALPAIGIGFVLANIKWKYRSLGDFTMGFGLLFMGLYYLTRQMNNINDLINLDAIGMFRDSGFTAVLIGAGAGVVMAALVNSSSASIAIIMTMAYNGIITYEMAAGMVLGSNIGTTISAPLVALVANTDAKRAALVHVLFNFMGTAWALPFLMQLLALVDFIIPGELTVLTMPVYLAALHTLYNTINAILFLPFINQLARLVCFILPDKKQKGELGHYKFDYISTARVDSPELNILRAEKEIRDMAGIASSMYASFSAFLRDLREIENKEDAAVKLCEDLKKKEEYTDEMRESLSAFLIECTQGQLNTRSKRRVSQMLRVVGYIEEMSDACYIISLQLEKSVRKNRFFSEKEMDNLIPYLSQVEEFLALVHEQLGSSSAIMLTIRSKKLEADINKSRKQLQRLGRKRIEAGKNVKTELFFIDLVRRIEKLGDYCYDISSALGKML